MTHTPSTSNQDVWNDALLANPHAAADKRQRVQKMFAAIAPSYDLNNRLHSLWMDQRWRKKAVKLANLKATDRVVDVACGTGDLSLRFARRLRRLSFIAAYNWPYHAPPSVPAVHAPPVVLGIDFTYEMLPIAESKSFNHILHHGTGDEDFRLERRRAVQWLNGDAMSLPLPDQSADVVSIAFGIRNVADPAVAIREFYRVLRPGGRLIILEFSLPTNPLLRGLYNFYFRKILPRTATLISRDKTGAYKYLPESVNTFITREKMSEMMSAAGFKEVTRHPMTFGVCVCYRGVKS